MAKVKYEYTTGHPDIKDSEGLWIKSFKSGDYTSTRTRSVALWNGVRNRTTIGFAGQKYEPTYLGCTNCFEDYQTFTTWCQDQYGYMLRDVTGKYWQIDKDIISPGNKVYGPENCIFVPARVNNLFITRHRFRGEFPLGVYLSKDGSFTGSVSINGKVSIKSSLNSKEDAHLFWQKGKIEAILNIADNDPEVIPHTRLKDALYKRVQIIQEDIDNSRETSDL